MTEPLSFVKACKTFFEEGRHGRKMDIQEFKALSQEDKVELRELLIGQGFEVLPLGAPAPSS